MAKPDDQSGSSSRSASSSLSAAAAAAESDDDVGEDGDEDDTHKRTDADDGEKEATEDAVDDDDHDDDDGGSINGLGHGTQDDDDDSSSDNTDPSKVATNLKTALEQLDLSTGKILASFSSYDEAFARVRHTSKNFQSFRAGIDNNVHGRAKSSVGYFWRHAGSNKIPPNSRRETGLAGIEQLDLWTGTVLASFSSYEEAFEHFRITSTNFLIFRTGIYNNIRGRSKSSLGYFWRHAGSNKLPYSFKRVSDGSDSSGKDDDRYQLEPPKTTVAGTSARSPASSKNGIKLTGTDQLDCDQDDESESESQDDQDQKIPAKLSIFRGSPYEEVDDGDFVSAEVREPLFEEFHNLLAPVSQSKSSTVSFSRRRNGMEKPSPAAIAKLGYKMAYAMVTAKEQISLTGIAYSPEWLDSQRIRGNVSIPGLNASMILLGLRQERLCRADVAVLIRLSKELGVAGIVQKALGEWNWNEEFPELSSLSCHFSYKYDGRLAALKCQIFVARTYECMTLLDYHPSDDDDEGIKMKLKACLQIMQVSLTGESIDLKDTGINDAIEVRNKTSAGYFSRKHESSQPPELFMIHNRGFEKPRKKSGAAARPPNVRKRGGQKASVAVEQLDLCTGKVLASYASMAAANASLGRYSHGGISDVVRGRTKSTAGYFWRRAGSQVLPDGLERDDADDDDASLSATEENNADDHLEEVETSAADDETAARPPIVRKRGGQKASVAVEQLDLCTGKVLASYASMAAANASLGRNSHGSISDVVRGKTKSTAGYFWRRAGSQVLPDGLERDDADGDDASLAAAKENNADDRQVNPRVQLPLQLSQSSAEKLPQEVNELRYVSPKSSSSRKSASGPPDRSTTSGESAGKAVASCTSVLPDNAAEFPYGLLEGDDDHDNKNTDNNEAEVKPAAAAGQVPVLHAESPSDDEESLESAPAAKKLPHTTKRVTHHGMVGNDTPPWKTQKRKEATTTPTPKPKPRMAVAAAVGQHPRTSLTTTNNNNNKNDKNTGTSSSAGRTRKRKRDKKLNAEELVDLMERQYKQSWRLFKKFRRAVRRTRGVVVDEGRQAGEVVL